MKLTKNETLEYSIELWKWLVENPKADKSDWSKWEFNGGGILEIESDCFCCEYSRSEIQDDETEINSMCKIHCPVGVEFGYCGWNSLWWGWDDLIRESKYEEATENAIKILEILENKLSEINNK